MTSLEKLIEYKDSFLIFKTSIIDGNYLAITYGFVNVQSDLDIPYHIRSAVMNFKKHYVDFMIDENTPYQYRYGTYTKRDILDEFDVIIEMFNSEIDKLKYL